MGETLLSATPQAGPACGPLIAVDALVGAPRVPFAGYTPDVADLEREMARLCISSAVVRHRSCLEAGPYFGNDVLMDEIAGHARLIPAWFITPDGREPEWDAALIVQRALSAGVRLAWTDPVAEMMSLQPWCAGPMYAALQQARMPLLMPYKNELMDDLHAAMASFPGLRVILYDVQRLGRNRLLEPLLAAHPGLYLCFGPSFSVHDYFRNLVNRFGPERWVFGSGYPTFEGGAGVAGLLYSGLTVDQMAAVAHGNLERLMAEVRA